MTATKRVRSQHQPTGTWIRPEKRLAIYLRDQFRCGYCRRNLHRAGPQEITLDHLEPLSNGANHEPCNLITACKKCNSVRQSKPWKRFATAQATKRITRQRRAALDMDLARSLRSA